MSFKSPPREGQAVPESNCNSNTRRKVQHWMHEQCATPASIDGPESVCSKITSQASEGGVSTQSSQSEVTVPVEVGTVEVIPEETNGNTESDSESVLEVIRTKKKGAAKRLPDTESDHISECPKELPISPSQVRVEFAVENNDATNDDDDEDAVEGLSQMSGSANRILGPHRGDSSDEESEVVGVRVNTLRRRRIESSQSTASTSVQQRVKSPPKIYDNPDDVPRVIKKPLFKSRLLQKPAPVIVKPVPSNAENEDPYTFKCSQKTPEVKDSKKKKARTRGKSNQEKGTQGKRKRGNSSGDSDWEENEKTTKKANRKTNKLKKSSGEVEDGIKRMNTYGKEPEVILFDAIQEQNTAPFSSPSDIVEKVVEPAKPQKKERLKRKAAQKTHKEKLMDEKTNEQIEKIQEHISAAEDFEFVFSQQLREEGEEYRKKLKKKTKDNPRTNRVSFDNKMTICNQEGETQVVEFEGEKEVNNGEHIEEEEKMTVEILIEGVDTEAPTDPAGDAPSEQKHDEATSNKIINTTEDTLEQNIIEDTIEDPASIANGETECEDEVNLLPEEPGVNEKGENSLMTAARRSIEVKEPSEENPKKTAPKRMTRRSTDGSKPTGSDALNSSGLQPKTNLPKENETPSKKGDALLYCWDQYSTFITWVALLLGYMVPV